jgi:AraC-like DNA-binding protein
MFDHSSRTAGPAGDPLTEILRGLRLEGVDYQRCVMAAPWGIAFPAQPEARFHFIAGRGCWLQTPAGEWTELLPGDAVLLPRGAAHAVASAPGAVTRPLSSYTVEPLCENVFNVSCCGDGARTLLFCGSMRFSLDGLHPLFALMPDVLRICDLAAREPEVPHFLAAMAREVAAERVGAAGVLARLADVLAATIIRAWVERGCGDATGWLAAVRHPKIGKVLAAIHRDPTRDWTVESMAALMGASRSGFAQHFTAIVGETPARYVTRVRMHQARQWLTRDRMKIAAVARRLGYESEAAFSRAFKRVLGVPPGRLRAKDPSPAAQPARRAHGEESPAPGR